MQTRPGAARERHLDAAREHSRHSKWSGKRRRLFWTRALFRRGPLHSDELFAGLSQNERKALGRIREWHGVSGSVFGKRIGGRCGEPWVCRGCKWVDQWLVSGWAGSVPKILKFAALRQNQRTALSRTHTYI